MPPSGDNNAGGGIADGLDLDPFPAKGDFDLQLTDKDVEDALDFDIDFDAMAESMGNALPNIDFGEMGSLGTRSPSPSASESTSVASGSKRSRADFAELDSESECDSQRDAQAKRMVFAGENFLNRSNSGLLPPAQPQQPRADERMNPINVVGAHGTPSSRCQTCGLQTHRTVMTEFGFELQPLNIEGEVVNGECIFCKLLTEREMVDARGEGKKIVKEGARMDEGGAESRKDDEEQKINLDKISPPPLSMGSPSPRYQQIQNGRVIKITNNTSLPPPSRDLHSRGTGKSTPTPNQYHSKMALSRQAQLPRKHSAMEHARSVIGNSNNRGNRNGWQNSANQKSIGDGAKLGLHYAGSNRSSQIIDLAGKSGDADESYSRPSHFSHNGGTGRNIIMGMHHCTETMSTSEVHQNIPQQSHRSMSFLPQSPHPQTPHSTSRSLSDQIPKRGSSTPQSIPVVINTMSERTPKSVTGARDNMNSMLSKMSGVGGTVHDISLMGKVSTSTRLAHSNLQSSIYHHHIFPLDEDTERAHIEKTLVYIEGGSGDICDIICAMRRFPFSPAIQRASCNKLYAHCIDQETAHAVGLVGGIRTTIDAMEHHPDDSALQLICIGLIKNLATASAFNQDMLDRMGSVTIIISTMERHAMNAPLLEACCWTMESMARNPSSDLRMSVAQGGGIQAAMKAVEIFPGNESLLKAAFHCLRQLGYNPSQYNSHQQQPYTQHQRQRRASSSQLPNNFQSLHSHRLSLGGGGSGGVPHGQQQPNGKYK